MTAVVLVLVALNLALAAAVVVLVRRGGAAARRMGGLGRDVQDLERRWAGLLAATRDGVLVRSVSGELVAVNDAACEILRTDRADLLGRHVTDLPVAVVNDRGLPVNPASVLWRPSGPSAAGVVVGLLSAEDDAVRWVRLGWRLVAPVPGSGRGGLGIVTMTDLTVPIEAGTALTRVRHELEVTMDNAIVGMAMVGLDRTVAQTNGVLQQLLGRSAAEIRGADLLGLVHPEDRRVVSARLDRLLDGTERRFSVETRYLRPDSTTVWAVLDVTAVPDETGALHHLVVQTRDVTEARLHSEIVAHRAMHDPLTGLANRALVQEVLQSVLEQPGAVGRVAVLACDLDRFALINNRFGHTTGDEVLVHVAGVLRATVAGRGTVARLSGDGFVVVVQHPEAARVAQQVAGDLHRGLRMPVTTQHGRFTVQVSIGMAVVSPEIIASGAPGLLAAADVALRRAKAEGRSRTEVFDGALGTADAALADLAAELPEAIASGQVVLHYQPIVDLGAQQLVGYEALVRWHHPNRGLLMPAAFLGAVGETGLAVQLGTAVVSSVADLLSGLRESGRWISVNVSANQLGDGEFVARLTSELTRHRLTPGRLVIELTESSLVEANTRIRHELSTLRSAGVPVLLDDFGTGVSPMSYLRDLPVNGVKLDLSFTAGIPDDPAAARVTRALGAMARELGMITIAEGIETPEQAAFLSQCGWRYGQGWLFGSAQPLPRVA